MVWKEPMGQEKCGTAVERASTWSGEMGLSGTVRPSGVQVKAFCVPRMSPDGIHFGIENRCPCVPSLQRTVVLLEMPFRDTMGSQVSDFLLHLLHLRRFFLWF